jgi:hypothetical protein
MAVDTKKLGQFLGQFVNDLAAPDHAGMVVIVAAPIAGKHSRPR